MVVFFTRGRRTFSKISPTTASVTWTTLLIFFGMISKCTVLQQPSAAALFAAGANFSIYGYWRAFQRSYAARLWITLWLTTKFLTPPSFSVNRSQQPVLDLYIFTGVWKATYALLIFNLYTAYPVIQRVLSFPLISSVCLMCR